MPDLLRLATWNLGYGSPGAVSVHNEAKVKEALAYCHGQGAQIVLAQEMYLPFGAKEGEIFKFDDVYKYCIFNYVPLDRPEGGKWKGKKGSDKANADRLNKWGTAILSTLPLEPVAVAIKEAYPGTITVAKYEDVYFVSMYGKGCMDKIPDTVAIGTYSYAEMIGFCLDDLQDILLKEKVVLSGDWNIGHFKTNKPTCERSAGVIKRICDSGFQDSLSFKEYTKTFHGGKINKESQVDWVFVSKKLADKSRSYMDNSAGAESLSDHYPLTTELHI